MSISRLRWTIALLLFGCGSVAARAADIVPVVSAKSSVTALSKNEIVDIFLGKRARFPDGMTATPIDQAEGSAARKTFYSEYAEMSPAQLKAFWAKIIFTGRGQPPKAVDDAQQARKLVATDPNAITYMDRTLVNSSVKIVSIR